jgi:MFS family permease
MPRAAQAAHDARGHAALALLRSPPAHAGLALTPPPLLPPRFAIGLGSLIWGPISDRWGRRYCLYTSAFVYLGFATGCIFSRNISERPRAAAPTSNAAESWQRRRAAAPAPLPRCA